MWIIPLLLFIHFHSCLHFFLNFRQSCFFKLRLSCFCSGCLYSNFLKRFLEFFFSLGFRRLQLQWLAIIVNFVGFTLQNNVAWSSNLPFVDCNVAVSNELPRLRDCFSQVLPVNNCLESPLKQFFNRKSKHVIRS